MAKERFRDNYFAALPDLRGIEEELVQALAQLGTQARHPDLGMLFQLHLDETRGHLARVEELLSRHGVGPTGRTDGIVEALVREAAMQADRIVDPDVLDAVLIAWAQRIEHYEIAAYGTVATYARSLGLDRDHQILLATLNEEEEFAARLAEIANDTVNRDGAVA